MMTTSDTPTITFPETRGSVKGYDKRAVDDFLTRARTAFEAGAAPMTSAEVRQAAFPLVRRWLPWLAPLLSMLGRNSLAVFSIGSVSALAIQLVRASVARSMALDFVLIGSGILLLLFTAWFVEWRIRSSRPTAS